MLRILRLYQLTQKQKHLPENAKKISSSAFVFVNMCKQGVCACVRVCFHGWEVQVDEAGSRGTRINGDKVCVCTNVTMHVCQLRSVTFSDL